MGLYNTFSRVIEKNSMTKNPLPEKQENVYYSHFEDKKTEARDPNLSTINKLWGQDSSP